MPHLDPLTADGGGDDGNPPGPGVEDFDPHSPARSQGDDEDGTVGEVGGGVFDVAGDDNWLMAES